MLHVSLYLDITRRSWLNGHTNNGFQDKHFNQNTVQIHPKCIFMTYWTVKHTIMLTSVNNYGSGIEKNWLLQEENYYKYTPALTHASHSLFPSSNKKLFHACFSAHLIYKECIKNTACQKVIRQASSSIIFLSVEEVPGCSHCVAALEYKNKRPLHIDVSNISCMI